MAEKNIELEILQEYAADLTSVIATNPTLFGQHLVQCGLAVLSTVDSVNTSGGSDYYKGTKLLSLVDNKIRTAESKESARKYFDHVLKIFAEHMGNRGIVESLVKTYKSKDASYVSPIQEGHAPLSSTQQPTPESPEYRESGHSRHYLCKKSASASSDHDSSFDSQHTMSRMSSCASGGSFDEERSTAQAVMQVNQNTIQDHFAGLLKLLRDASSSLDAAEVYQYLTDYLQETIPRSRNVQKVYNFLSRKKFWTYQHYDLVQRLNTRFLENSLDKDIKEYKEKLSGYFAAKKIIASEFFRNSQSPSERTTQCVTEYDHDHRKELEMRLDLDRQLSSECLDYVAKLWDSLSKEFKLPSITALIDKIIEKCLEVTWLILPSDAERIIARAKDHHNFFRGKRIILLAIDGCIIYEETSSEKSATVTGASAATPNPCLYFSLLGECRFGDRCRFEHIKRCPNPVTVYVHQKELKLPLANYAGYKERNPDSHKGFILLPSDRDPSKEIKILAEGRETAEYAQTKLPTIAPAKKPRRKRECIHLKLLGGCHNRLCSYEHKGVKPVETPSYGYFRHPMGLRHSLKDLIGNCGYTDSNEAYVVCQSEKDPNEEVKILAESTSAVEDAMRRLTVITGRKYAEQYISICYVHPEGIADPNQCLRFQKQYSSKDEYGIVKDKPKFLDMSPKSHNLDTFLAKFDGKRHSLESVSEWLKDPNEIPTLFSNRMIYEPHIWDDVHDKLRQALEWVGKKEQFKLRGWFGKLNFSGIDEGPCDVDGCDTATLMQYLFQSPKYKCFFNSKVSDKISSLLKSRVSDTGSTLEAYELKLSVNSTHRLAVHLEFQDGRPVVTQLKADDSRVLMVDVMCLNHDHDLRIDLSSFKIVSPQDYPEFSEFISRIGLKPPNTISLAPVGSNQDWSVSIIRQKTIKAYSLDCLDGKKYWITVSSVREYRTKERDLKTSDVLEVDMSTIKEENEIEMHNLLWDVSIASQFGQSPEDCLRVLLKPDSFPSELKSFDLSRYNADVILQEFKRENFLQLMNDVNGAMDTSH